MLMCDYILGLLLGDSIGRIIGLLIVLAAAILPLIYLSTAFWKSDYQGVMV